MKAVYAGGGTAGHVIPGIVLGRRLMEKFPGSEVLFFTLKTDIKSGLAAGAGFRIEEISAGGLLGKGYYVKAISLLSLFRGFLKAIKVLKKFKPDVIIGGGGYVSAPVLAAGVLLGIKIILLEQNYMPGLTTRGFARFAEEIELSFSESAKMLGRSVRCKATGNPVRREIVSADRRESAEKLGISQHAPVLFVLGGSSGAESLNTAMEKFLKKAETDERPAAVCRSWQFIHLTGRKGCERMRAAYKKAGAAAKVAPFMEEIWHAYACCDLIVSRCGGNTVAEISARGIPAVYAPYPGAGGHQELNALNACERGAAVMIKDSAVCSDEFTLLLLSLMEDGAKRRRMAAAGPVFERSAEEIITCNIAEIIGGANAGRD